MAGATATQQPQTRARRGASADGAARAGTPATRARSGTRAAEAAGETRASPPWRTPKYVNEMAKAFARLDPFAIHALERIGRGEAGMADLQLHCGIKADNRAGTVYLGKLLQAFDRAGWLDVNRDGGDGNFRYALTARGKAMAGAFAPLYAEFGGKAS